MHLPEQLGVGSAEMPPKSPAAQSTHVAAPAILYRPAGHAASSADVDPAAQTNPALQAPEHVLMSMATASP